MKKLLVTLALITGIAGIALAQQPNLGTSYTQISEVGTDPTTNYFGTARVNINTTATPSTNSPVWKIVRITTDASGNVIEKKTAYGSGLKDQVLWTTAWTNRVAATYK
jgi:hypothetical protein